jgi:predicted site-specific integrase-resolvase
MPEKPHKPDLIPMRDAAKLAGVARETVSRWVQAGRLKRVEHKQVRNLVATLVDPKEVQKLAEMITSGRPRRKPRPKA